MVNVPSPAAPSVAPSSQGTPYQNAAGATPEAFGAAVGTAEQGLARQVETSSDVLAKHAMRMQEDLNVSHAEDLFLNGSIELGQLQEKYKSLEGAARVNALPKFMEDAAAIRAKYKESAPNPDVNKKFDQLFTRQLGYAVREAGGLAGQANRQYARDTSAAVQANSMSNIAKAAQDDRRFEQETQTALESMRRLPDYQGAGPEVRQEKDMALTTGAWATRLQSLSKDDPIRARDLFNKNLKSIDGITQLKLKDGIDQQIMQRQSRVDADEIVQSGALVPPELRERVKKFEGYSEKPYPDFKQTSSGYGTKAEPGDENIPASQRKEVYEHRLDRDLGRAAAIVDNFAPGLPSGTRKALISLTYNAGSSWTSAGLGHDIRAGDMEGAKSKFLQYTKAGGYDSSALIERRGEEASWFGGEARDTDPISQMGAALEKAKERAIRVFPDDPTNQAKYLDTVQSRIKSDFNVLKSAAHDMQLQTRNIVQRELFDVSNSVTSYDKLSPMAQQAYDQAPPALQHSFDAAMRRNSIADVPLTAERQARFDTLRGESINEPDKFMSRDISSQDLPRPQQSILLKAQADRKALVEKGGKLNSAMSVIQGELNDAQIGKSSTDTAKNEEYNKFSGVFSKYLDDFYQEKKRPPNEKEIHEIRKKLLRDTVTAPGRFYGNYSDRAYRVISDKTPITLQGNTDEERDAHFATIPRGATFVGPDKKSRIKP